MGWVDRLLLAGVVAFVFTLHREVRQLAATVERGEASAAAAEAPRPRAAAPQPEYMVAASRHTIAISPGGVTESRVSRVARTLSTDVGWEGAPVSQAADMRERDGLYNIAFALARHIDERSVQVTTEGNVLSLSASAIGNPHAVFVKRFYIPCCPSAVETSVSNGIVRVCISPAP
ncbi:MAG: hypothetical protein FWG50_01840 [Kiritimatiellaeota bacterium]|nr:hypothetical protein [Kiritimatiellota bacterium]